MTHPNQNCEFVVNLCGCDAGRGPHLRFHVPLSPAQELIGSPPVPFALDQLPVGDISGYTTLVFHPTLSQVDYKLFVLGITAGSPVNQHITMAHLHAGLANENGPVIVGLANLAPLSGPGVTADGLLASGTLTNENIIEVTASTGYQFNSIASLYQGIIQGIVYANVHGSNFNPREQSYASGIMRGQIFLPKFL